MLRSDTTAFRVSSAADRKRALTVLRTTYAQEKHWVDSAADVFPPSDLGDDDITRLLATVDSEPAGILRVHYAPPIDAYRKYDFEARADESGRNPLPEDVDVFLANNQIAEIGRFAVLPDYRRRLRVVFWLMRVAGVDTFERGYSHYLTDVFEGEEHSPYNFHTRVLGFEPVATHEAGEMNCFHRRITLILDLHQAYRRLKDSENRLYRFLARGLTPQVQQQITG